MPLTNTPTGLFLLIALAVALIGLIFSLISLIKIRSLNAKLKIFLSGKNGKDLESTILENAQELKLVDKEIQELFEISNKIHTLAFRGLHKVGIIRFNPFKDIGGDQSFAIALLDGKDNGFVLSSLHTREGTRVYTKPIIHGTSKQYTLTEEERQAIKMANAPKSNQGK